MSDSELAAAALEIQRDYGLGYCERLVADAWLAEHPPDDSLGIDAAWLETMTPGKTHFKFGEMLLVYLSSDDNWCAIVGRKASQVSYAVGGFVIKTRGQVRRLIAFTEEAAIPLTEPRQP